MMFARAIADPNPVYYSEEAAKAAGLPGIPAPPTFVQASAQFDEDYFLRPQGRPSRGSAPARTRRACRPRPRATAAVEEAAVVEACTPSSTTSTTAR